MKNYTISAHAIEAMRRRQISEELVRGILEIRKPSIRYSKERASVEALLDSGHPLRPFLFRVLVDTSRVPAVVLTVYRTTRTHEYRGPR